MAKDEQPPKAIVKLRTDGPTLEDFMKAGYNAADYPPKGYEAKPSPAYSKLKAGEAPEALTHIAVRARNASFRRGGLTHGPDFKVYSVADIGEENAARILKECEPGGMLDGRRITAYEAESFASGNLPDEGDEGVSKATLRQWVMQERARADAAEKRYAELLAKTSGADHPPKRVEDAPGVPVGNIGTPRL